ncbi:hypothetical protein M4578_14470 [Salipiger sp. P9]|uniref:hypothetical protein n=1 Tax=Salipiger pentaromativorans TaxID=2943193 RepID=UPI002157F319|nr:hypothetical protein [Salipiger pentaromativorans]MCR8549040.1 hypothetical protein [Salipiger pentaromativorans]
MSLSKTPPLNLTDALMALPLSLPRALAAWLFHPEPLVASRRWPERGRAAFPPNVLLLPAALIIGTLENLYLAQTRLRAGAPIELPYLGALDLRTPELSALLLATAEIAAFYLCALVPLLLFVRLFLHRDKADEVPALATGFAALGGIWLTALMLIDRGALTLSGEVPIWSDPARTLLLAVVLGVTSLRYLWHAAEALRAPR